jgi:hypothetical protein
VRVRPYTRGAAVLFAALGISCSVAASAGALSVDPPQVPNPGDPVNGVTGVTDGVTNTVNHTVETVTGTAGDVTSKPPLGSSPGSSGGNNPSPAPAKAGPSSPPSSAGGAGPQIQPRQARRRASARAKARRRAQRSQRAAAARPRQVARTAPVTKQNKDDSSGNPVSRVISRIERVIPGPVKVLIGVLVLVALGFAVRSWLATRRARRLERQRQELLGDVGLLQRALLPDVPQGLEGIDVSVAYRPAEGPAAGGDFYDVFELDGGRTAIIVGDVCGHGRAALAVTALMRYTLRAYAAAGFEPRVALQVAGRALDGDPEGALTTVVLAVYDPAAGALTYACAGHEPPIVLGPASYEPVTLFSSPPLGGSMATGQRQTTVALPPGSSACFFTDGLVEARLGDHMIGRERLLELLTELEADSGAQLLLDRLAAAADRAPDDMAACLLRTADSAARGPSERVEELVVTADDLEGSRVAEFLVACGVDGGTVAAALAKATEFGGAVIRVHVAADGRRVEVSPSEAPALPVPSLESARRRAALEVA